MSRIDLDQVGIASPCPMRWEELDGDERKRFCGHCSLHVHNLSAMQRDEAESFLEEQSQEGGRVCVTFQQRGDGSVVSAAAPSATQDLIGARAGRFGRALGAAASLLFALFPFLAACRPSEGPKDDATTSVDSQVEGTGTDCGIELLGEVALPEDHPEVEEEVDFRQLVGRISMPLPPPGSDSGE